jgi:hypothetical protein
MLVWVWWAVATVFCAMGCWVLWPVSWVEENWEWGIGAGKGRTGEVRQDGLTGREVMARSELRGKVFG